MEWSIQYHKSIYIFRLQRKLQSQSDIVCNKTNDKMRLKNGCNFFSTHESTSKQPEHNRDIFSDRENTSKHEKHQ